MKTFIFRLAVVIAVLAMSMALAACDQGAKAEKTTDTKKSEEGKVKATREGEKIKITGEEGEIVIDPNGAELPEHWPDDIPVFPKAKVTSSVEGAGAANMVMVVFETNKAVSEAKDFYKAELPKQGWKINNEVEAGETFVLAASKDARAVSVTVSRDPEDDSSKTIISINAASR